MLRLDQIIAGVMTLKNFEYLSGYAVLFYRDFSSFTAAGLQEIGLNFGFLYPVLYVGKHPGCTQGEMKEALKMDWGYCQRSVERLVKDGFMEKEKSGTERGWHLKLTGKGEQAFLISRKSFEEWDRKMLSCLSDAEREDLFSVLKKIGRAGIMSGVTRSKQRLEVKGENEDV